MSIRDVVDQLRQSRSASNNGETPFGRVCGAGSGRTIGDGMYATAKVTGALGILTLVIKALPVLGVCFAGCLFCIRGCLMSVTRPSAPHEMVATPQTRPPRSPSLFAPSAGGLTDAQEHLSARRRQPRFAGRSYSRDALSSRGDEIEEAPHESTANNSANDGHGINAWSESPDEVDPVPEPQRNRLLGFSANIGESPERLLGAIREHNAAPDHDASSLFHAVGGRTFIGTSQQPGQPSARTKLTIEKIRERGREITAHLSLLDRPRLRQAYTGLIEVEPLRLTLTPQRNPQEAGGMFLPYTSWQVGCPTTITLELSKDGQRLSGTSISGEEFELAPTTPLSLNIDDESEDPLEGFQGLSVLSDEPWIVLRRNGTTMEKDTDCWTFEPTSDRSGHFRWTRSDATHAEGTYSAQPAKSRLTIRLQRKPGQSSRTFHALVAIADSAPDTCRVCVAAAGDSWPKAIDRKYGTVFELARKP